jgi:hypothetical protein
VAFERLTAISRDIGYETGWSLSMAKRIKVYSPIADALDRARSIKVTKSSWGSTMAMSKFLHFVNPALFPIYDNQVIEQKVFRTFAQEWSSYRPLVDPGPIPTSTSGMRGPRTSLSPTIKRSLPASMTRSVGEGHSRLCAIPGWCLGNNVRRDLWETSWYCSSPRSTSGLPGLLFSDLGQGP